MQPEEQKSLLTIALLAAFADAAKHDREREEVRRVAESLGSELNLTTLYQDVLLQRSNLAAAVAGLATPALRQLAYEIAVGVCDADGLRNAAETRFLDELARELRLNEPVAAGTAAEADALAVAPLGAGVPAVASGGAATGPDLDRTIINAAILNGALELLPQSVASLAIIPLQMRLVYAIGQAHGYELDRGHIRDLLATLGVGLTGQYLEGIGRKLIGGLLGKAGGGLLGGVGRTATGAAFSFATTWAIGQVARRYYAGGRVMTADTLRQAFAELSSQGQALTGQYLPRIQQEARSLDLGRILGSLRTP